VNGIIDHPFTLIPFVRVFQALFRQNALIALISSSFRSPPQGQLITRTATGIAPD
jgi:hypothetical protein